MTLTILEKAVLLDALEKYRPSKRDEAEEARDLDRKSLIKRITEIEPERPKI